MCECYISTSGVVHLADVTNPDFTLCGDAFDIGSEDGMHDLTLIESGVVNCSLCAKVILSCRGAKIARVLRERDQPTTGQEGEV